MALAHNIVRIIEMARPKLDHDERRAKIAAAACDVILEVGLENAKLVEVAMRAGVTTGAVQHYFRSKEELLFFAKNHVFDVLMEKARAVPGQEAGIERLRFIVKQHLPLNKNHINAIKLLEAFRGRAIGNPTLLSNQHKRDQTFLAVLEHEISALKEQGLTRSDIDVKRAALGLNAMLDGLGCIVMPSPKSFKDIDLFAVVDDYIRLVLCAP
jgi:TetR/AcrR family transcriptional regulator, transcriptional repressor of bet genes